MSNGDALENLRILDRAFARHQADAGVELADDLMASWPVAEALDDVDEWMTRPGILRRVAGLLAQDVPADADRIIAVGSGGQTLGTAMSLTTGLPFASIDELASGGQAREGAERALASFGRIHTGETVAVVSVIPPRTGEIIERLERSRLTISNWQVVLAPAADGDPRLSPLFVIDDSGTIAHRKDADR